MRNKSFGHNVYAGLKATVSVILFLLLWFGIPVWIFIDTIQQLHGVFLWTFIPNFLLIAGMCYSVCLRPFWDAFAAVDNHDQRPQS